MFNKLILFIWLVLGGWGCSLAQNAAVNRAAALVYHNSKALEDETNWEMFRRGVPGNLQLLVGLLSSSPENPDLLAALTKGYTSYAYLVDETDALGELLSGNRGNLTALIFPSPQQQAILNYSKAVSYGIRYLQLRNISYQNLITAAQSVDGISKLLAKKLSKSKAQQLQDLDVVLFTAQAMMGLVNFRKNDLALVAQVPIAKGMFDWACSVKNDLYYGACGIFYGAYEASRPTFLGGNPEKGKAIFQETIREYPDNYLARIALIQYFLAPRGDYQGFLAQKAWFDQQRKSLFEDNIWDPPLPLKNSHTNLKTTPPSKRPGLNLFQQSAAKKFEMMKKYEKEIFFRRNSL